MKLTCRLSARVEGLVKGGMMDLEFPLDLDQAILLGKAPGTASWDLTPVGQEIEKGLKSTMVTGFQRGFTEAIERRAFEIACAWFRKMGIVNPEEEIKRRLALPPPRGTSSFGVGFGGGGAGGLSSDPHRVFTESIGDKIFAVVPSKTTGDWTTTTTSTSGHSLPAEKLTTEFITRMVTGEAAPTPVEPAPVPKEEPKVAPLPTMEVSDEDVRFA